MKKILIVDVPEGYEIKINSVKAFKTIDRYHESVLLFTEFTPPSDEEIEKELYTEGDEYAEQSYLLAEGAKWFKSLLT